MTGPAIITRRDFLKVTGAAAGAVAAGITGVSGAFDLGGVAKVFENHPKAASVAKIKVKGADYYMPICGVGE